MSRLWNYDKQLNRLRNVSFTGWWASLVAKKRLPDGGIPLGENTFSTPEAQEKVTPHDFVPRSRWSWRRARSVRARCGVRPAPLDC